MEINLKKALTEMMVLALLCERERHAPELVEAITAYSGGAISITFPYSILYRMIDQNYIQEVPRRKASDGRRRQFFAITEEGAAYFRDCWQTYRTFTTGVNRLVEAATTPEQRGDAQ